MNRIIPIIILALLLGLTCSKKRNKCESDCIFCDGPCEWKSLVVYTNSVYYDENTGDTTTVIVKDEGSEWGSGTVNMKLSFKNYKIMTCMYPYITIGDTNFMDTSDHYSYISILKDSTDLKIVNQMAWERMKAFSTYPDDVSDTHGSYSRDEYFIKWNNSWIKGEYDFYHRFFLR